MKHSWASGPAIWIRKASDRAREGASATTDRLADYLSWCAGVFKSGAWWKAYVLMLGLLVLTGAAITVPSQLWYKATGTGGVLRKLADKVGDSVSVKDFGAVGDGVTDDSTAVANALAASGTNQILDFACPGNYKTTLYGTLTCGDYYPPMAATGAYPRSMPTKILDIIDVKDFGAVGDGVADDHTAFQNAINALSGNGRLNIPSGTYKLGTVGFTVAAGANIAIAGASRGGTRLTYSGTGTAIAIGTSAGDTSNVTLEAFNLDVSTGTAASGISFTRCQGGFIRDVYVQAATSGTDSGVGIALDGAGNYVASISLDRVRVNGNWTKGIYITGPSTNTANHIDLRQVSVARTTTKPGTGTIGIHWNTNAGDGALLIPDVDGYDTAYEVDGRFLIGTLRAENNTTAVNFGAAAFDNMLKIQGFSNTNNVTGLGAGGAFNTAIDPTGFQYTFNNGSSDGTFTLNETTDHKGFIQLKCGNASEQQCGIKFLNKSGGLVGMFYKTSINDLIMEDGSGNQFFRVPSGNPAIRFISTRNMGTCTLNGGSPATCTATVTSSSTCLAVPQGTTAAAATHTLATSVSVNTLTVTGANGLTDTVSYWCG